MTDDLIKSVGELRMVANVLYRKLARLEQRVRDLEAQREPRYTGTVQGLEGIVTITPIPEWSE